MLRAGPGLGADFLLPPLCCQTKPSATHQMGLTGYQDSKTRECSKDLGNGVFAVRERRGSIANTDLMSKIHILEAGRGEWMETVKEASGEEVFSRKASQSDETPGLVDFPNL